MPLPKIDILIPAIEKDLGTLPYVIDSVRKQVKHPIGKFMIVSPDSKKIRQLCARKGCTFINEKTVLPITKKSINYQSARWDRSGWLFQQLLKLGGSKLGKQDYYLVIDADTVLIRPHVFKTTGGRTVFYYRKWSQPEYFKTYKKLMGRKADSPTSFVTHYMLFERAKVARLKRIIEAKHQTSWHSAIIRSINKKQQFGFSEFETYGNFLHAHYRNQYVLKKALNTSLHMNASGLTEAKRKKLALKYRSVSFHKRKAYSKRP
ncbi:hypothetical protein Back11_50430 [Paenibacillus baekrokdamisoli]|uniref:Uncharacterized protein n=1 Tax=Paenibacillus baekrokdamisoli TaxID=1712516 RepID=A0A3G9JI02_9BACL|nr:DUF6492 family protein [Paenibacillus baekrokdamisoli]MBB3068871.1 hypothetical protein [Paenibacillus baekrokdamisoli]BBH23698.1 hypothetical protein Back11_50430 [Paenibacillus baekrokdamisoli]